MDSILKVKRMAQLAVTPATLEAVGKVVDPMAWKAWEITDEIKTRRAVSLAKAKEIVALLAASVPT